MNQYVAEALSILDSFENTPSKQSLIDLIHYTISRDK